MYDEISKSDFVSNFNAQPADVHNSTMPTLPPMYPEMDSGKYDIWYSLPGIPLPGGVPPEGGRNGWGKGQRQSTWWMANEQQTRWQMADAGGVCKKTELKP